VCQGKARRWQSHRLVRGKDDRSLRSAEEDRRHRRDGAPESTCCLSREAVTWTSMLLDCRVPHESPGDWRNSIVESRNQEGIVARAS
jgi:hypothetical protein